MLGSGCQPDSQAPQFPIHVTNPNRISHALLLSEVQQADVPAELLDADFLLENRSSTPQTITLVGKSCSCYGVRLDDAPLELHVPMTLEPSSSRVLRFEVAPPSKAAENSWVVRLASIDGQKQELKLSLKVRVYADVRLEPDAIVTSIPPDSTQPGTRSSSALRHDLTIRRTWRGEKSDTPVPSLKGLPTGWGYTRPVVSEEPREVDVGLWQQTWQTAVQFSATPLSVVGPALEADSENQEVRLKVTPLEVGDSEGPMSPQAMRHAVGVHRIKASFEANNGETVAAHGRFVVRAQPGIVGPTVVHWGSITAGESRTRRIMLSASDDRAFTINSVSQSRTTGAGRIGKELPSDVETSSVIQADRRVWNLKSTDLELMISLDDDASRTHQSLQLDVLPLHEGLIDETFVLKTNHPLTPTIEVRVRAIVMPADTATTKADS